VIEADTDPAGFDPESPGVAYAAAVGWWAQPSTHVASGDRTDRSGAPRHDPRETRGGPAEHAADPSTRGERPCDART
jgi:hypothetical protein